MGEEIAVDHLDVLAAAAEAVGRRVNADEPAALLHVLQQSLLARRGQVVHEARGVDDHRRVIALRQLRESVKVVRHLDLIRSVRRQNLRQFLAGPLRRVEFRSAPHVQHLLSFLHGISLHPITDHSPSRFPVGSNGDAL